jgi:hypothetical protein
VKRDGTVVYTNVAPHRFATVAVAHSR